MPSNLKLVPIKFNPDELVVADWLKTKTKRTRAGAVKWAMLEKAEELGYVAPPCINRPLKQKKRPSPKAQP